MPNRFTPEIVTDTEEQQRVREWAAALRSGTFKQGRGFLRPSADRMCCLGVACHLYDPSGWASESKYSDVYVYSCGENEDEYSDGVLPPKVRDAYRLFTSDGRSGDDEPAVDRSLAALNDGGASFAEIADVIECELAAAIAAVKA